MLKSRHKWTVTFAATHSLLHKVAKQKTQSHSSTKASTHGESVKTTETCIYNTEKLDASANEQLRAPPPDGLYSITVSAMMVHTTLRHSSARGPIASEYLSEYRQTHYLLSKAWLILALAQSWLIRTFYRSHGEIPGRRLNRHRCILILHAAKSHPSRESCPSLFAWATFACTAGLD